MSKKSSDLVTLSLKEFKQRRQDSRAVVVFFSAVWCAPCKRMYPLFDDLKDHAHSQMDLFKVDGDTSPEVIAYCEVTSFPTFRFYFEGKLISSFHGADKEKLVDGFNTLIRLLPSEDSDSDDASDRNESD